MTQSGTAIRTKQHSSMTLRVKNWEKFQHYKHRDPPWIKLHRGLLNDREWYALGGESAKTLVMLWLIASERDGTLPAISDIAFRLRMAEEQIASVISRLSHWLVQDASTMLADRLPVAAPETETETEKKEDASLRSLAFFSEESFLSSVAKEKKEPIERGDFGEFWRVYPHKVGKTAALKAFKNAMKSVAFEQLMVGLHAYVNKTDDRPWCNPATWLNQGRWDDKPAAGNGTRQIRSDKSTLAETFREIRSELGFGEDRRNAGGVAGTDEKGHKPRLHPIDGGGSGTIPAGNPGIRDISSNWNPKKVG